VIQRRVFIAGVVGSFGHRLVAEAQPAGKVWRVGFLGAESASTNHHFVEAFRAGMRERGYVEGQTFTIEQRWAEGRSERFRDLTGDLIRHQVNIIVTISTPATLAAKSSTRTMPIVFIAVDPIGTGLISSLARPGGNVTGLSLALGDEFAGKWLELLAEAIPGLSRVAVLWNPTNPSNAGYLKTVEASAQTLGTKIAPQGVATPDRLESAFGAMASAHTQAVIVFIDPLTVRYRERIVGLAAKKRLPAMYGMREFADAGGLMAYGSSVSALCRRASVYVDKIFRGSNPGELPVEQATQFEFVINLKTAKTLGLKIPRSLLLRADETIQ
jgi:putative ABC transport system substrate-binding protein